MEEILKDKDYVDYVIENPEQLSSVLSNLSQEEKDELLVHFTREEDMSSIKLLVENGADASYDSYYVMMYASYIGDINMLSYFVSKGVDIRTVGEDCESTDGVIFVASLAGKVEVLKYAKSLGIDLHAREDYAFTLASSNGHLHILEYLYNDGADVRAREDEAIFNAYKEGRTDCYEFLVSKGAILPEDADLYF